MSLPATIPLFPLPNAVLFPGVPLPLHIFEPRYRAMVEDAGGRERAQIGMVLLRGDWRDRYHGAPEIFPIGCAGQLVRCDRLEDGRYNILLHGTREFRIRAEVGDKAYRQAEIDWREPPADALSQHERARVRDLVDRYLGKRDPALARHLLDDGSLSDEILVNFLSYSLDFPPMEKQALLEEAAVCNRTSRLCELIEFALGSGGSSGGGSLH